MRFIDSLRDMPKRPPARPWTPDELEEHIRRTLEGMQRNWDGKAALSEKSLSRSPDQRWAATIKGSLTGSAAAVRPGLFCRSASARTVRSLSRVHGDLSAGEMLRGSGSGRRQARDVVP